jgi:hypothetical protein
MGAYRGAPVGSWNYLLIANGRKPMTRKLWLVIVGALITTNAAWAGPQLESLRAGCTTINCGGMSIRGIHQRAEPFIAQVFAAAGECLRLDIDEQTEDMALLLISPSVNFAGLNDDRDFDGGDFRPLFGLDPVPFTGWYTVVVSYFDLDNRVARFNLRYARYRGGNPNCLPLSAATAQTLQPLSSNPSKVAVPAASATVNPSQDE